jgi:hypothetical protein
MNKFLRITALLTMAVLPAAAASFTIHNTGGAAVGDADPNWTVNDETAFVTFDDDFPFGPWLANSGDSSWISPTADYSAAENYEDPGEYRYSTTFDLDGLDAGTATLSFRVAADDGLTDVLLNGASQGFTWGSLDIFSDWFTINTGFNGGTNVLTFVTVNGDIGPTPAGLRVEFADATADALTGVPEPGSIALLGFGTLLLLSRRFRTKK